MSNPLLHGNDAPLSAAEKEFENHIRPQQITDFAGQEKVIENLRIFIKAAKMRGGETGM